jgi:hypothetical protein
MVATMKSLKAAGIPVWVFMIHSSEIAPCKPLPTEEAVKSFVERCEQAIAAAVDLGARGVTLSEAAEILGHAEGARQATDAGNVQSTRTI